MRFAWVLVRWPLLSVLGLAVASAAAMGLGILVYRWRGEPNNWRHRERQMETARFLAMANPQPVASRLFSGLGVGIPRTQFVYRQWTDAGGGALAWEKSKVRALFETDRTERVTRIVILASEMDETNTRSLLMRIPRTWGAPAVSAGDVGGEFRLPELSMWRFRDSVHILELDLDESTREYRMQLTLLWREDPRRRLRPETEGLPPWHRHAEEVRKQLKGRPIQTPPSPLRPIPTTPIPGEPTRIYPVPGPVPAPSFPPRP